MIPGAVTGEWVEHTRITYGEESAYYRSRVLAEFPKEDSDGLIAGDWIERAFAQRKEFYHQGTKGTKNGNEGSFGPGSSWCSSCLGGEAVSVGVDVARYGEDSTVIVTARGGTVLSIVSLRKRDLVAVADAVEEVMARHGAPAERVFVDDTGLGGGVTDILRARDLAVRAVHFGAKAREAERFLNRKAEIYWHVRRLFEADAVSLAACEGTRDGEIMREQLRLLRVYYSAERDAEGRIGVRGEAGRLARPSTSPDHADALAMALAPFRLPPRDRAGRASSWEASWEASAEAAQARAGIWLLAPAGPARARGPP